MHWSGHLTSGPDKLRAFNLYAIAHSPHLDMRRVQPIGVFKRKDAKSELQAGKGDRWFRKVIAELEETLAPRRKIDATARRKRNNLHVSCFLSESACWKSGHAKLSGRKGHSTFKKIAPGKWVRHVMPILYSPSSTRCTAHQVPDRAE